MGCHGAYPNLAPADVARAFDYPVVIVANHGQDPDIADIRNGLHALMRTMAIYPFSHAGARLRQADLVLNPDFRRTVDILGFAARRECVAAGVRAVRLQRESIAKLLAADATSPEGPAADALATPDLAITDLTAPQ